MAISNSEASAYTTIRKPFMTNNKTLFGTHNNHGMYMVFSYSTQWPLYAYVDGQWYRNVSKYSKTTTAHLGYARPRLIEKPIIDIHIQDIVFLNQNGLAAFISRRLRND